VDCAADQFANRRDDMTEAETAERGRSLANLPVTWRDTRDGSCFIQRAASNDHAMTARRRSVRQSRTTTKKKAAPRSAARFATLSPSEQVKVLELTHV
jgi:hypothetical protein